MIINLPRSLENSIQLFCELNEIKDINDFLVSCLSKGFSVAKYGENPIDNFKKENKPLEIEKYVEEKIDTKGLEVEREKQKSGRPKKEKEVEPIKKDEEPIKVKKKIRILKD